MVVEVQLCVLAITCVIRIQRHTRMVDGSMDSKDRRPMTRRWADLSSERNERQGSIVFADVLAEVTTGKVRANQVLGEYVRDIGEAEQLRSFSVLATKIEVSI